MAELLAEYWYLFYRHEEKPKVEETQKKTKNIKVSRIVVPKFEKSKKRNPIVPQFSNDGENRSGERSGDR